SALRRRALANSLKTSNAISLPGLTSLNRSGFDAIILYHFDAAELAPSTASKADILRSGTHVRFTPRSGHQAACSPCPLRAKSGHRGPYSITSSAATIRPGEPVKLSAFAVLRLRAVSYLVGVCTGRSAGFAPRRMRST